MSARPKLLTVIAFGLIILIIVAFVAAMFVGFAYLVLPMAGDLHAVGVKCGEEVSYRLGVLSAIGAIALLALIIYLTHLTYVSTKEILFD